MINHKHKFIFTHIPKCAGSSIHESLGGKGYSNHKTLEEDLMTSKQAKHYFKFTFVRNPWDRFISAYFYFKKYGRDGNGDVKMGNIVNRYNSFKDFVLNFNKIPASDWVYPHFKEQINWVCGNHDFIGKSENLQQDFNIICEKIGIPKQQLLHTNKSNHKHYTDYYDDETRQIVAEKYAKDIQCFNYKFGE